MGRPDRGGRRLRPDRDREQRPPLLHGRADRGREWRLHHRGWPGSPRSLLRRLGGPLLGIASDGSPRVIGDLTGGDGSCVDHDNYTRIDLSRQWIEDHVGGGGPGPTGVTFFQHINYGGAASGVKARGNYATLPGDVPNDWMSSLRVPAGWTVEAYEHINFGGAVCTYRGDTAWVGSGCNDKMSSFRIY